MTLKKDVRFTYSLDVSMNDIQSMQVVHAESDLIQLISVTKKRRVAKEINTLCIFDPPEETFLKKWSAFPFEQSLLMING
jgi:hypothetical protein